MEMIINFLPTYRKYYKWHQIRRLINQETKRSENTKIKISPQKLSFTIYENIKRKILKGLIQLLRRYFMISLP